MNTTQKIFNKLSNGKKSTAGKKQLSKKTKVDLSLVEDTQTDLEYLQDVTGLASYYVDERFEELENEWSEIKTKFDIELDNLAVNSEVPMIEEFAERLTVSLDKIQTAAEELGIPPNEIYDNYDEARQEAARSQELYDDFRNAYKELVRWGGFNDFL